MNPSHELISGAYGSDWIKKNIEEKLDGRVTHLLDDIGFAEELNTNWFMTEHHWRIGKALQAYDQIV